MNFKYVDPKQTGDSQGLFSMDAIPNNRSISFVHFNEVNRLYADEISIPHKHDFYSMIWIEEGSLTQMVDDKTIICNKGTILLGHPHQLFRCVDFSTSLEAIGICIPTYIFEMLNSKLADSIKYNMLCNENSVVIGDKDINQQFFESVSKLKVVCCKDKLTDDDLYMQAAIFSQIMLLLKPMFADCCHSASNCQFNLYLDFMRLLDKDFRKEHKVTYYANTLNVGKRTLERSVKASRGKSPAQLIHNKLLEEAKYLLVVERKSLKEIANVLGFVEYPNFSNYFKLRTGYSPMDYLEMFGIKTDDYPTE